MESQNKLAEPYLVEAASIFKKLLLDKYKEKGIEIINESDEFLLQDSAYDVGEELLELKNLFKEMVASVEDIQRTIADKNKVNDEMK